jgi:hypothetical protein
MNKKENLTGTKKKICIKLEKLYLVGSAPAARAILDLLKLKSRKIGQRLAGRGFESDEGEW